MRKIGPVDERINERIISGLNENEKMIINFLQNQTKIHNRDAVELTKLSPAHIRRLFISLQDKKLIVTKGKGRDRGYTLLF
jgi:ATP-dependent DNA helicase RecG